MRPDQLPHEAKAPRVRDEHGLYAFRTVRQVIEGVPCDIRKLEVTVEYPAEALAEKFSLEGVFISRYRVPPPCLKHCSPPVDRNVVIEVFMDIVRYTEKDRQEYLRTISLPTERHEVTSSEYERAYEEVNGSDVWRRFCYYYTEAVKVKTVSELYRMDVVPHNFIAPRFDPQNMLASHWPMK